MPLTSETLKDADLVLLVTDHSALDYGWIAQEAGLIVDTRNAFKDHKGSHIFPA